MIDGVKWVENDPGGIGGSVGNVRQSGSLTITGDSNWGVNGLTTLNTFDRSAGDVSMETDVTLTNCGASNTGVGFGYGNFNIVDNPGDSYAVTHHQGVVKMFYFNNGGATTALTSFTCSVGVPFHLKLVVKQAGGADLYINNAASPNATIATGTFTNKSFYLQNIGATQSYDNVSIRGVVPEPIAPVASNVEIGGFAVVGNVLTGSYDYADGNGDSEGSSVLRWLISDTVNGVYSPIEGAVNSTYTPVANDLNKYIKFEVTPIATVAPTTGVSVSSSAVQILSSIPYVNHVLSTGQSLSIGHAGEPALTTTQIFNNLMLSGSSLVPLVENVKETMSSTMANEITRQSENNAYQVAVTMNGVNGLGYVDLKKGTAPYANGLSQVSAVKNSAMNDLNKAHRVVAVTTIHGETDHSIGSGMNYENFLVQWQNNYEVDIKAITGQSENIPLFTDQVGSFTGYGDATSEIPIAQLAAAENNPGKIYLVGPKYFLNYSDNWHLNNLNYRWLGEYYGKVMARVLLNGEQWKPLSPEQITRNGREIFIRFHVPAGQLQFDTELVDLVQNYGFEYYDDAYSASIESVEIITNDTVKLTLNSAPVGGNQRVRYAYTGVPNSGAGAHVTGSARGNLRDSDTAVSQYGNTLYNWSVQFDKSIGFIDETAPSTTVNIEGGSFGSGQTITLTCNDNGGSGCSNIYYTVDGSTPDTNSTLYNAPLSVSQNTTIKFFARDIVGNSEVVQTKVYVIDETAPNTTIDTGPEVSTYQASANFIFSATEDGIFECQLDGGGYFECVSPKQYVGLSAGAHILEVRAIDQLGNIDLSSAQYAWTVLRQITEDQTDDVIEVITIPNPKLYGESGSRKSFSARLKSSQVILRNITPQIANGKVQIRRGNRLIKEIPVDARGEWKVDFKSKKFQIYYLNEEGTIVSISKEYKLKVDTEKPEVFLNGPIYVKHRGSSMSWRAKDNDRIDYYKISIGGRMIKTKNAQIKIPAYVPRGLQSFEITAFDRAGNKTTKKGNLFVTW